ncbi:hypothetical protein [Paenibacillus montanisoli]|uniref:Uncharacterized protein n=1 Tax=Paenibacillus montanisoli TaxID=2081970 RepID=A0A328U110_9BACL|nr:hypothetical protein [Paenibacillus montanisoli]RAP75742.1 hypothetical protein DL346_09835 [Paenibacillus montanisoli]
MKRVEMILCLFMLSGLFESNAQSTPVTTIETIPAPEGGWTYIPEGRGEMIIHVETSNAKEIKVWRVPTGTQQWENRQLVCAAFGNITSWNCVWKYNEDDTIHDHFVIWIVGEGWEFKDSINVTRKRLLGKTSI